jgi:hypothetical protein
VTRPYPLGSLGTRKAENSGCTRGDDWQHGMERFLACCPAQSASARSRAVQHRLRASSVQNSPFPCQANLPTYRRGGRSGGQGRHKPGNGGGTWGEKQSERRLGHCSVEMAPATVIPAYINIISCTADTRHDRFQRKKPSADVEPAPVTTAMKTAAKTLSPTCRRTALSGSVKVGQAICNAGAYCLAAVAGECKYTALCQHLSHRPEDRHPSSFAWLQRAQCSASHPLLPALPAPAELHQSAPEPGSSVCTYSGSGPTTMCVLHSVDSMHHSRLISEQRNTRPYFDGTRVVHAAQYRLEALADSG